MREETEEEEEEEEAKGEEDGKRGFSLFCKYRTYSSEWKFVSCSGVARTGATTLQERTQGMKEAKETESKSEIKVRSS